MAETTLREMEKRKTELLVEAEAVKRLAQDYKICYETKAVEMQDAAALELIQPNGGDRSMEFQAELVKLSSSREDQLDKLDKITHALKLLHERIETARIEQAQLQAERAAIEVPRLLARRQQEALAATANLIAVTAITNGVAPAQMTPQGQIQKLVLDNHTVYRVLLENALAELREGETV